MSRSFAEELTLLIRRFQHRPGQEVRKALEAALKADAEHSFNAMLGDPQETEFYRMLEIGKIEPKKEGAQ